MTATRRSCIGALAALTLVLPLVLTGTVGARSADDLDRSGLVLDQTAEGGETASDAFATQDGDVQVLVELDGEPAAKTYARNLGRGRGEAVGAARAQLAHLEQAQRELLDKARGPDVDANPRVIFQSQRTLDGIGLVVSAQSVDKLRALPGVKDVHPLPVFHAANSTSVPWIGATSAWSAAGGLTGRGIRVGIIDSGIDYIHKDFGGPGTSAAYTSNSDKTKLTDNPSLFPNAKVVGGWDFVGDNYDPAIVSKSVPQPDPDPYDCYGHGTHVSGTAAGLGVTAAGNTYAGSYDSSTPVGGMKIGPGVAPEAKLYALKVFGCTGNTAVITPALDWAVDPNGDGDFSDHLDVVNMSLGSAFGSAYDPSAVAANNASLAGVVVVGATGNSYDTYYIGGSPGAADRAISVASATDGQSFGLLVNAPASIAGYRPIARMPRALPADPGVTGDLAVAAPVDACTAPANAAALAGRVAIVDVGGCHWSTKALNVQAAGAAAIVLVNNQPGQLGGPYLLDQNQAFNVRIPGDAVTPEDGAALKAAAGSGGNVTLAATMNASLPYAGDQLAQGTNSTSGFSSRGLRRGDNVLKPDVTAPGVTISSAANGSGTGSKDASGTSMAAPHVAGTIALLRQLHPDWSVEDVKALVMNTATHDVYTGLGQSGLRHAPARIGAGRVDLRNAITDSVVAMDADGSGRVSVSFGEVEALGVATAERTIRVANHGSAAASYRVSYDAVDAPAGVSYSFPDGDAVTVAPGGSVTFRIRLTVNGAVLKHERDATLEAKQAGTSILRHYVSEASGFVVLTPDAGRSLRVPVDAVVRPASRMAAEPVVAAAPPTGSLTLHLTGQGVNTGSAFPVDDRSVATVFELAATSPDDASVGLANNADLKELGIGTDFGARNGDVANSNVYFAVATWGKWTSLYDVEFDVYVDTNRDGVDDYVLFNTAQTGFARTDANVVQIRKLTCCFFQSKFPVVDGTSDIDTVLYNSNVLVLPVRAGDLGLSSANSAFNYRVVAFSRGTSTKVDAVSGLHYDVAHPGLDASGGLTGIPLYFDLPGGTIPVKYDLNAYTAAGSKGILLFHHFNVDGERDQVVRIVAPSPTTTAVDAASGQYSDRVFLRATVGPSSYEGQPPAGVVTFSVDGTPVGSAPVDASGVATLPYTIALGESATGHDVTAQFASSSSFFLPSSGAGKLTVSREDAAVVPSSANPTAVKVTAAGSDASQPFTLTAVVTEPDDGSAGDVSLATPVTFTLDPVAPGTQPPAACTAATSGGAVGGSLTATCSFANVPVNVYDVLVSVGGSYYRGSGETVVTVFDPSLGSVTGGGRIVRDGVRANFGFNIRYQKNGSPHGSLLYVEHRPAGDVIVKSPNMDSLAIVGSQAVAIGKAVVNGVGGYSFRGEFVDAGEPGTADRFGLGITDQSGGAVADLSFAAVTLEGGNIQIP